MSRFFLCVGSSQTEGNDVRISSGLKKVAGVFEQIDAPLWYDFHHQNAFLLIGGHDKSIYVDRCSFCAGTRFPSNTSDSLDSISESGFAALSVFCGENKLELTSNLVAGKSAWYYHDQSFFIVSSSQRAIVNFLGSFQFNEQAMAWMLATGNLGPGNSWDSRIRHIKVNTRIVLDRRNWQLSEQTASEVDYSFSKIKFKDALSQLEDELNNVFTNVALDHSHDILALSGGYDSRLVLSKMNGFHKGMNTVTWGLSSARFEKGTDAFVASNVARAYGVNNLYFETDIRSNDFEVLIDKYLLAGEGRIDHINSFMDGLQMWQNLALHNYRVLYRADEVFGWLPCSTEKDVRISLDFHFMDDNSNMLSLRKFDLPVQEVPEYLDRMSDESLPAWRDRLYRCFRLPCILTGLHDVESSYMEVFNPLLHDSLIRFCIRLPDDFRTNKKLYSVFVSRLKPSLSKAIKPSIPEPSAILRFSRLVSLMIDEFHKQECRNLFGKDFINWVMSNMEVDDELINRTNNSLVVWFKSKVPWQLKKKLRRDLVRYRSDFNQLAFRIFIISRMKRMLESDASANRLK